MSNNLKWAIAGVLLTFVIGYVHGVASATDDSPCGDLLDFKYDGLDGYTFTIPTPPAWLTVESAVVKVGGPGGGTHIVFDPASAGDTLDVSYQQYQISHVHVCKSRTEGTTTSTTSLAPTTTTTLSTTTTTQPSSTSTTPAPTTTALASTSTSSPETSSSTSLAPSTSAVSSTVALTNPPVPTTTQPSATTSPSPATTVCDPGTDPTCNQIPKTGNEPDLAFLSSALFAGGVALVAVARRRKRTA